MLAGCDGARYSSLLVVRADAPWKTLAEFVAFCRESGLSRETCAARLGDFVMTVVSEGYAESGAA